MSVVIPDKIYFKIGEVSDIVGVKPYVLRYWETEFRDIIPVKSRTNQRLYRRKDVELVLRIRELLHKERFTIDGAKKRLKEESRTKKGGDSKSTSQLGLTFESDKKKGGLSGNKTEIRAELSDLLKEMQESIHE